jgi:hypothetical protein
VVEVNNRGGRVSKAKKVEGRVKLYVDGKLVKVKSRIVTATKIAEPPDEIEWHNVTVIEAHVRGKTYRIEKPRGCGGEVNVYCNGEFIGPSSGVSSAKDGIARGLL